MSKKKLNATAIQNELTDQSVFFQQKPEKKEPLSVQSKTTSSKHDTMTPRNRDTTQSGNHDTTVSRYHATMIENVRKAVKQFGKEAATHRFTMEEKNTIADILYAYKRQGIRTSENEITRIAINYVIEDRQENGENSILDIVLKALNE